MKLDFRKISQKLESPKKSLERSTISTDYYDFESEQQNCKIDKFIEECEGLTQIEELGDMGEPEFLNFYELDLEDRELFETILSIMVRDEGRKPAYLDNTQIQKSQRKLFTALTESQLFDDKSYQIGVENFTSFVQQVFRFSESNLNEADDFILKKRARDSSHLYFKSMENWTLRENLKKQYFSHIKSSSGSVSQNLKFLKKLKTH